MYTKSMGLRSAKIIMLTLLVSDLPRLSMGVITRCKDQTHPGKQAFEPQPSLSAIPATSASKPSCASSGAS